MRSENKKTGRNVLCDNTHVFFAVISNVYLNQVTQI